MLFIQEAERIWLSKFGHMNLPCDDSGHKALVSKVAWVNGYVFAKIDLSLALDREIQQLIEKEKLHGIYDIEFNNGCLHGKRSRISA
ncbi:hypothetical protein MF4642_16675 [Acinetobacter sp. MF4642]|uniref:hypothetical protein n=1 Tax=Acinetobacter sp. MF4642 TaxID=1960825 RepID=UPI0009954C2E|nr:hypothetical protein [Acinetobacter sp. MF4642]OOW07595.1 hypothetical protein MF4642_16675 [Acinetobacter sp. MF4642]